MTQGGGSKSLSKSRNIPKRNIVSTSWLLRKVGCQGVKSTVPWLNVVSTFPLISQPAYALVSMAEWWPSTEIFLMAFGLSTAISASLPTFSCGNMHWGNI
jgi:hypothetical protein